MRRQHKRWLRNWIVCLPTLCSIAILMTIGCSGGSRRTVADPSASPERSSEPGSSTGSNTPFDAPSSSGSPAGTPPNLFDTDTSKDKAPVNQTQLGSVGQTEAFCLQNDMGLFGGNSDQAAQGYGGQYGGVYGLHEQGSSPPSVPASSSGLSSAACFNGSLGSDSFLGAGLSAFGQMGSCFRMVASRAPTQQLGAADMRLLFLSAQMALVRCYRQVNQNSWDLLDWAPQQQQGYQNTDSTLFLLLTLLSKE